jgi:hypothetical protein
MHVFKGEPHTRTEARQIRADNLKVDVVVAGGGLSGVCCAITAARAGARVALVQDRPVLGGNASSEVRLWVLGATSHMGNNNRWAREGGVIDELLVENLFRNREGNPIIFDTVMLEWVQREPNIRLLLNTAIDAVDRDSSGAITQASAYCSQNQTRYTLAAPIFCDASGDGVLGFLAGAAFRIGAEARGEFNEGMAPEHAVRSLLGHSLYFYSRDTDSPVRYVPPAFALPDIKSIPRFRELKATDSGCRLWWLEYGGTRDTVYETEEIKWELWKVAYGVWNHIKNSGEFPDAANLTLEWMGTIPGKRESRRFEGDVMLTQQDIVEQHTFPDAVGYGGWAIDLHPAEGVYSARPGCEQWHSKGVYQIPYRTMYSRNVPNLFLTGRLISASHIAFGSTRVMATCAHNGQAVGLAAAMCVQQSLLPRDLVETSRMHDLQQRLLRSGQWIPGVMANDAMDLAQSARVTASSELQLDRLVPSGEWADLDKPTALLLPLTAGPVPSVVVYLRVDSPVTLKAVLASANHLGNNTPDRVLAEHETTLAVGEQSVALNFNASLENAQHVFVTLQPIAGVQVALSREEVTGVLTVSQKMNKAVAKSLVQTPPSGYGVDTFGFWLPDRRPVARNLAADFLPALIGFAADNVVNGYARPWTAANAWIPARDDAAPALKLTWPQPVSIGRIEVIFDTDFDHPMESVLMGHPENVMPACVTAFALTAEGTQLAHVSENHQTRRTFTLSLAAVTSELTLHLLKWGAAMPAVFAVRCYS